MHIAKPRVGDTTINVSVFSIPEKTKAEVPPASNADPMRPLLVHGYSMMADQNTT